MFEKPHTNDWLSSPACSEVLPITIFDPRPGIPAPATMRNLKRLLSQVGVPMLGDSDPLDLPDFHITNAVKCDKWADAGRGGQRTQADVCREQFLFRELKILAPKALVFFGKNAERFVCGDRTTLAKPFSCQRIEIAGSTYWGMRVHHSGYRYFDLERHVEPLRDLFAKVSIRLEPMLSVPKVVSNVRNGVRAHKGRSAKAVGNAFSRDQIQEVLKRHGYQRFNAPHIRDVRTLDTSFGERLAVTPGVGQMTLWVRCGGGERILRLHRDLGGDLTEDQAAISFRGLDLMALDRQLGKVITWLRRTAREI